MLGLASLHGALGDPLIAAGDAAISVARWRHGDAELAFVPDGRVTLVLTLSATQHVRHRIGSSETMWKARVGRLTTISPHGINHVAIEGRADILAVSVTPRRSAELDGEAGALPGRDSPECARLMRQLLIRLHAGELADPVIREAAATAFQDALLPTGSTVRRSTGSLTTRQIGRVSDLIEARLDAPEPSLPPLKDMADVAGISRHHFAREFRRSVGQSPYSYASRRRLARAEALLVRTAVPVEQVASRYGFASAAHLKQRFREALGLHSIRSIAAGRSR